MVCVRALHRTVLFGGCLVLLPDAIIEVHLALALHLVRNGMAEPANPEAARDVDLGLLLQAVIPRDG